MDPKLLQARAEIEEILRRHDIAGITFLHNAPHHMEVFTHISPSYSRLSIEKTGTMEARFRFNIAAKDFGGDIEEQKRIAMATANMAHMFAHGLTVTASAMVNVSLMIDEHCGFSHTGMLASDGVMQ